MESGKNVEYHCSRTTVISLKSKPVHFCWHISLGLGLVFALYVCAIMFSWVIPILLSSNSPAVDDWIFFLVAVVGRISAAEHETSVGLLCECPLNPLAGCGHQTPDSSSLRRRPINQTLLTPLFLLILVTVSLGTIVASQIDIVGKHF